MHITKDTQGSAIRLPWILRMIERPTHSRVMLAVLVKSVFAQLAVAIVMGFNFQLFYFFNSFLEREMIFNEERRVVTFPLRLVVRSQGSSTIHFLGITRNSKQQFS